MFSKTSLLIAQHRIVQVTSVATLPDADNGEGFIRATDALNVQARPQASQVDQDSQVS